MAENTSTQKSISAINKNHYWGFWATLALSLLVFVVFSTLQSLFLFSYMIVNEGLAISAALQTDSTPDLELLLNTYAFNGDAISVSQIPAALVGIALVFLFVMMRKTIGFKNYLELYRPTFKQLFLFLGLMILAMMMMETVNTWLDRPTPEFMTKVYSSTNNLPLLWIAVGISAPLFEEILFRGFFFDGLRHSAFGTLGAILVTSACWAIIHMQYGWFEIISIFFIGILLALAKLKTRSLYVPIAMHMLMNLAASLGMHLNQ